MSGFRDELINGIEVRASVENDLSAASFMNEMADRMSAAEEIENLQVTHFRGRSGRANSGLDGYDISDGDDSVAVAVAHFDGSQDPPLLTTADVNRLYGLLESYLRDVMAGTFPEGREPSEPSVQVAKDLFSRGRTITRFRLYLFSDLELGPRFTGRESIEIAGVPADFHVWDVRRLETLSLAAAGRQELILDLTQWLPSGLPALRIPGDGTFETYLAALPGDLLADLYGQHGSRLLESNVRSFLSGRGSINRAIKTTILRDPGMFLAYNNGITATATSVQRNGDGSITGLRDLQIVNGGQTTASLFYVRRDTSPKPNLSQVVVQVKLVVIDKLRAQEIVPDVSRFANSQNRISEADFFSNSGFHVRMEEHSRRVLVPSREGGHYQTKWFYERTRGQYQNEKSKLPSGEGKKFEATYPRKQLITKTDAAKYVVSWNQEPHRVSAGAQKNFLAFAQTVAERWQKNDSEFNEDYFKELCALAIIFQSIRQQITKSDWYQSGYLANITTYTVAKLSHTIEKQSCGKRLDLQRIWIHQAVPTEVLQVAADLALLAFSVLTSEHRPVQNVTEWAKKEHCWTTVRASPYKLAPGLEPFLLSKDILQVRSRDARQVQKMDNSIGGQTRCVEIPRSEWIRIQEFAQTHRLLSPDDAGILSLMTGTTFKVPSERQAARLLNLKERAENHGFQSAT